MEIIITIDINTTVQRIKAKYNGRMDVKRFDERMAEPKSIAYLCEVAELVGVEIATNTWEVCLN